jgi:hypothetical protein
LRSPQTTRRHQPSPAFPASLQVTAVTVVWQLRGGRRVMFNGVQWQLRCRPGIVLNASAHRCHELT